MSYYDNITNNVTDIKSTLESSTAITCNEDKSLSYYHWINFVVITIIAVIGLVSQVVVITVLWMIKKKTSTDIFLLALSMLDIFVIISLSVTENGSIYLHILHPGQQMLNAGYIAVIAHPFEHIAHFASTWCIVLMSLDRYISICHTTRARFWCTVKNAKLQLVLLLVFVTLYSIPRFLEYYSVLDDLQNWIEECDAEVHRFPEGTLGASIAYIWSYTFGMYLLIMYILPLGLLCFFNYHLIRIIKGRISFHKKRNKKHQVSPVSNKQLAMISKDEFSSTDIQEETKNGFQAIPKLLTTNGFNSKSQTETKTLSATDQPGFVFDTAQLQKTEQVHNGVATADPDSDNSSDIPIHNSSNNNTAIYKKEITTLSASQKCKGLIKAVTGSNQNLATDRARARYIQRQYDHVIRMLITVTVVFSICQIPDMVQQLISRIGSWEMADEFGIIAYDFVIINSSINLFIYTATSQRFKRKLMKTFKSWKRNKVNPLQPTSFEQT